MEHEVFIDNILVLIDSEFGHTIVLIGIVNFQIVVINNRKKIGHLCIEK